MFKVLITLKDGSQTFSDKKTLNEANEWIEHHKKANSWGLPERWIADSPMSPLSEEEKATAKKKRKVQGPMGEVEEYFFGADYEIDVKDITQEIEAEKTKQEQKRLAKEKRKADRKAVDWSKNLPTKQLQEIVRNLVEDKED